VTQAENLEVIFDPLFFSHSISRPKTCPICESGAYIRKQASAGNWWLMPVTLDTWGVEIERIAV
jgi:hypothetical protein